MCAQFHALAVILLNCQRADCLTEEQSVVSGVIDSPVCHSVSMWNVFQASRCEFSMVTTSDGYGWTFYLYSTCLARFDATVSDTQCHGHNLYSTEVCFNTWLFLLNI